MFTLNLLSEKQKTEVRFEIYNRFLIQIGITLVAIMIIFSVLLIPTFIFLLFQKSDLKHDLEIEQKSQENVKVSEAENAVEVNNGIIQSLKLAEAKISRISPVVSSVFGASVNLATISELKYTLTPKEVMIRGQADDIKKFLAFKDALDELPYFTEKIISPSDNLVKLKNVSFTLRGKLK